MAEEPFDVLGWGIVVTSVERAQPRRLDGQVAVVTGAGGGVGLGIAKVFADAGATLALADVDVGTTTKAGEEIEARGGKVLVVDTDVTDPKSVDALFSTVEDRFGRVDILVNNAGVIDLASLLDISLTEWRRVFSVNVEGCLLTTQRAAKSFLRQDEHPVTGRRGTIINIGSPTAEMTARMQPAYGASKAALTQLTRMSADELGEHQVAVSVLYPAGVREGMWRDRPDRLAAAIGRSPEEILQERLDRIPTGRFQDPMEVGEMALFLASGWGMERSGKVLWAQAHMFPL